MAGLVKAVLMAIACVVLAASAVSAQDDAAPPQENAAPSASQEPVAPPGQRDILSPIREWDATLGRIEAELEASGLDQGAVDTIRAELNDLRERIDAYVAAQRPRLPELEARLRSLGDPPAEGEPPEPAPVAEQRAQLRKSVGDLQGALKGANEARARLTALGNRAQEVRRSLFETRILERDRSPLSPLLWQYIARDTPIGLNRLNFILANWWGGLERKSLFLSFLIGAIALWAGLSFYSRRRVDDIRRWHGAEPPSEWQRTASAGQVILLRLMPTAVAGIAFYLAVSETGLLTGAAGQIGVAAIVSLIIVATVQAVTKTSLAIVRSEWRVPKLPNHAARRLYYLLMVLAAVYGLDFFISELTRAAFMPFTVSIGQSFISAVLIAALIISILRIPVRRGTDGAIVRIGPGYIRKPLWIIALFILGAALVGYVSLARFVAGQLIVTSTILIVAYLLVTSVSAFGQSLGENESAPGRWLHTRMGLEQKTRERLALPLVLLLKGAVIIAAIPFILLLWGFDWFDIAIWLRQALFGFEIGGVRISFVAIIVALLLFVLGYMAAKFFQGWLDSSVMERAGVDAGVRDSVRTGVGYVGIALATLLAVSYLGLDFSNLAIVAGALSVGVGFGLQSIVNNFVSGLILLAERPIKAGDWIIVGTQEGIVRKISVRSTEIETFDRANVIVPNSMLITETVKNWTLHNSTGRMPIPVGVHYKSDPEKVRDILLKVAQDHPQVLSTPEPFVFFEDFADSALNFILFVYLANVSRSFAVRTDLRIAILKAFRENGVEIPYPQTDVHLRDLDWLKDVIRERRTSSGKKTDAAASRRDYKSESGEADDGDGEGH